MQCIGKMWLLLFIVTTVAACAETMLEPVTHRHRDSADSDAVVDTDTSVDSFETQTVSLCGSLQCDANAVCDTVDGGQAYMHL